MTQRPEPERTQSREDHLVDLIARARKSYRTLDGIVCVSPRLLADLADELEASAGEAENLRYLVQDRLGS